MIWLRRDSSFVAVNGRQAASVHSLLDFPDIVSSLFCTLLAKKHAPKYLRPNEEFQYYSAFDWFLCFHALIKLKSVPISMDHFDRWAMLVDAVSEHRLKDTLNQPLLTSGYCLVQHGKVDEAICEFGEPWQRLRNVDQLHCFTQGALSLFQSHLLSKVRPKAGGGTKFFTYSNSLELQGELTERFQVLIIGHPGCFEIQHLLHAELLLKGVSDFYYKPHPRFKVPDQAGKIFDEVILDPAFFPNVDLVIGYPSTLVEEYKALGVSTFTHGFTATEVQVNQLRSDVGALISSIQRNKDI